MKYPTKPTTPQFELIIVLLQPVGNMIEPVINIASPGMASVEWNQCRLVIEMSQHYFHYIVVRKDGTVVVLKFYQFTSKSTAETMELLEKILQHDTILKESMEESVIVYNWPENCLVPEKYFHVDLIAELLTLIHGDLNRGVVFSEKVSGWDMYNVFRVPTEMHDLFQRSMAAGKFRHHHSLWLECQQKAINHIRDRVYVIFHPNEILVTVIEAQRLQLVQRLEYQTAEDVAYYLLNICERFHISPKDTAVQLSGMIDLKSAMYEELLKYFDIIETATVTSGVDFTMDFTAFPEHFFSPILNMAVCVS